MKMINSSDKNELKKTKWRTEIRRLSIETLNLNFNTKTSQQSKIQSSVNVAQQDVLRTCHILLLKTKGASILLLQKNNAKRLRVS